MSRRRTPVQRVTEFFLSAPIDEARQALDIARTIVEQRTPTTTPRRRITRVVTPPTPEQGTAA